MVRCLPAEPTLHDSTNSGFVPSEGTNSGFVPSKRKYFFLFPQAEECHLLLVFVNTCNSYLGNTVCSEQLVSDSSMLPYINTVLNIDVIISCVVPAHLSQACR